MLHTPLCDLLGITDPICQAGMATYTSPALVAAVSGAGGLGVHGTLGRSAAEVRVLIRETRALLTGQPFGVNHVVSRLDPDVFAVCLAESVPAHCFSWGDPGAWAARAHAAGARVLCQVTTAEEVLAALAAGADALIAQGTEAGGHSGFVPLAELLPAVVAAAGATPVLAAGGIAAGRDLAAALALGAAGGWLGTRFLATPEAPVSAAWKAAIVAAGVNATVPSAAFDILWGQPWPGARVRAIANRFTNEWTGREDALLAARDAVQRAVWAAERADDPSLIALMAGTGVGRITAVRPAGMLVRELVAEAEAAVQRLGRLVGGVVPA
jgi:NAD(P)H-dependent flavin oxidoreductase YrpB (nitropropane dioxygenase family)